MMHPLFGVVVPIYVGNNSPPCWRRRKALLTASPLIEGKPPSSLRDGGAWAVVERTDLCDSTVPASARLSQVGLPPAWRWGSRLVGAVLRLSGGGD